MSEWKSVVFYYDYDRPEYGTLARKHGLVSRAYKCSLPGFILHTFNGLRYFWLNKDSKYFQIDSEFCMIHRQGPSDMDKLNQAFDTWFDHMQINIGLNNLKTPDTYRNLSDAEVADQMLYH